MNSTGSVGCRYRIAAASSGPVIAGHHHVGDQQRRV
jgi:hypothetical protein